MIILKYAKLATPRSLQHIYLGANAQRTTVSKGQKQDLEFIYASFLHWLLICLNVSNFPVLNGRLVSHLTKSVGSGVPFVWVQWISIFSTENKSDVSMVSPPKTQSRFLSNIAITREVFAPFILYSFLHWIIYPFCHLFQPQNPILASVAISYWPKSWIQRPTIWETVKLIGPFKVPRIQFPYRLAPEWQYLFQRWFAKLKQIHNIFRDYSLWLLRHTHLIWNFSYRPCSDYWSRNPSIG